MALPLREAVRAIVIDDRRRLLLVRFAVAEGDLWATPGGGIEDGESHEAAIRRELYEEVGLRDSEVGPAIWTRTHRFTFLPGFGGHRETFYLVRAHEKPGPPGFSDEELRAEGLVGSRWWTLTELEGSRSERFAPTRLPELYGSLLAEGPPRRPIATGE
jgi:8-oxo-dGTP pyrophosphatase MutT (NUDIX family)